MESGHCPLSWPALLQDRWQWPRSPPGGSRHSPGPGPGPSPSPSPEEQGDPGPGVQGYSVLSSLVGPACIFLRPSIAATQLVCTVTACLPPTHHPCSLLLPLFESGERTQWGSQSKGTQIRGGGGQRGEKETRDQTQGRPCETHQEREKGGQSVTQRKGSDGHQGGEQGGGRAPGEGCRETKRDLQRC